MKKIFGSIMMLASFMMVLSSCNKDNGSDVMDRPTITAPDATSVLTGETATFTFSVNAPGKIQDASVTASAGTASVSNLDALKGQTSGDVKVEFQAPATEGNVNIELTVTDAQQKSDVVNLVVSVGNTMTISSSANGLADAQGYDAATKSLTLKSDITYILDGFVFVNDGQTLNIEAGTIIKGKPGQGADASALIVARGGKIMAEGTADAPIIFTGVADDLNGSVPNDANQLWGGVIILGRATTNDLATGGVRNIEGIPTEEPRGAYGGDNDADNSGEFKYVSIRHGGSVIGADNEINGLSLGAVGSATVIDHVEIFANFDDGIEFFGGDPNLTNIVISWVGDDGLDQDEGFHGTVQNALVWETADTRESGDPRGSEADGGDKTDEPSKPFATPVLANITLYFDGPDTRNYSPSENQTLYMRDSYAGKWYNSIFYGFDGPIDMERRTDKINSEDNKSTSCYDQWLSVAQGGYGNLKIENNVFYTGGATTDDAAGFATLFVLSDEADATKEADVEAYLMAKNHIVDPGFGTGANKFTPTAAEVKQNLNSNLPGGLTAKGYAGAVDPDGTPFFANWTKTWELIK